MSESGRRLRDQIIWPNNAIGGLAGIGPAGWRCALPIVPRIRFIPAHGSKHALRLTIGPDANIFLRLAGRIWVNVPAEDIRSDL